MRFSRLRINGFKSFADPTELLVRDGLTGIVGPNGCGKSNLLEALRWVMGENRPTAMRGSGMEDVIFNGAAGRPARRFAEVALMLERGPEDDAEVERLEVSRRISRGLGSSYRIDGAEVRARDVQLLFADAASGSHSAALVRQGEVSDLVNARPEARRRVLEEAAGTAGLFARRRDAELKLAGAERNLARVDEELDQLRRELSALARQARVAASYRRISQELREAECALLAARWRMAEEALREAQEIFVASRQAVARAGRAENAAREARAAIEARLPAEREEHAIAAAIVQRVTHEQAALSAERERALALVRTLEARLAEVESDITREETLNSDAARMAAELAHEEAALVAEEAGADAALAAAEAEDDAAAKRLAAAEAALSGLIERAALVAAAEKAARERLAAATRRAREIEREAQAAGEEKHRATLAHEAADEALAHAATARDDAARATEETGAALQKAVTAVSESRPAAEEASAAIGAAERRIAVLHAERDALMASLARDPGEGTRALDHIAVDPGHEAALAAAFGDDLAAPIAAAGGAEDDGATGWRELAAPVAPPPLPDAAAPLAARVRAPAALARRLAATGIVPLGQGDALQTILAPGQQLVSIGGDLWRWDGLRRRGDEGAGATAALRLRQENRRKDLIARIAEEEAAMEGLRAAHAMRAQEHDAARAAEKARNADHQRARQTLGAADRARDGAERDLARATSRLEAATLADARAAEALADAQAALAEAERENDALPPANAARIEAEEARTALALAREESGRKRAARHEVAHRIERRRRRQGEIAREIAGWRERLQSADGRRHELDRRRESLGVELAAARQAPESIAARGVTLARDAAEAQTRAEAARSNLTTSEDALHEAQEQERAAATRAGQCREEQARAESRHEAARAALDGILDDIAQSPHHATLATLITRGTAPDPAPPPSDTPETLQLTITTLRTRRDALGPVNLRAEDDAQRIAEEQELLSRDKAELDAAITRLRIAITHLDQEARERILAALGTIDGHFRRLFTHLFGGGEARLVLVDSDDPLAAGLEIMCQPPGKRLSALSLLSGGEQTLTALALIFAVFLTTPSPVCVLDEVDAALDDANVMRFCDLMDEVARGTGTRFLVITHHAVTMARMDCLFGVTMQERGVSQLVSVDLGAAEAFAV